MVFQPIRKVFFNFLVPATVNFSWQVDTFRQTGLTKYVSKMHDLRLFDCILSKVRGNEYYGIFFAQDDVSGHRSDPTN